MFKSYSKVNIDSSESKNLRKPLKITRVSTRQLGQSRKNIHENTRNQRRDAARDLAQIIYDIYTESRQNGKLVSTRLEEKQDA